MPSACGNNTESTARQYGLGELAAARLGWAVGGIEVIDTDLGLSGQLTQGRAGFKEMAGRVCLGEAGAIFGLEVSRLARSPAGLAKLLELARLTGTLVIDADGVYDLSGINDRMLLGLNNQMAGAGLHILGSRMDKAKRSAAARGELRLQLPVGFVRDDEGAIAIDPGQEVQAAVGDLFTAFIAAGSAYGVMGAFAGRRFPRRSQAGELTWAPLTYDRVLKVLSNPGYAGAFVFGRRRSRRVVAADGRITRRSSAVPRGDWETTLLGQHPCYITWDQFLANEAKLAASNTSTGARPVREGAALCQGIIHCGGCGRPMNVHVHGRPTSAAGAGPATSRRRAAGRSPQRLSTLPWPAACSPRYPARRPSWLSPPPTKSPTGELAQCAPPSSRPGAAATRPGGRTRAPGL